MTDTTAKAKEQTNKVKQETAKVSTLTGFANKLGIKTGSIDKAVKETNKAVNVADKNIDKVDNVAQQVNKKLDSVKTEIYPNIAYKLSNNFGTISTGVRVTMDSSDIAKISIPLTWKCTLADIKK